MWIYFYISLIFLIQLWKYFTNEGESYEKSKTLFTHTALISSVLSGVLYADTLTVGGTNSPTLTITGGSSMGEDIKATGWSSGDKTAIWDLRNGVYHSQRQKTAEFDFGSASNSKSNMLDIYGGAENKVGFVISDKANSVLLDFAGKGLDASGARGLFINFGFNTNATSGKTISITNLSSLKGDLTIVGGACSNVFTVNVGSMEGKKFNQFWHNSRQSYNFQSNMEGSIVSTSRNQPGKKVISHLAQEVNF